ncbi:MAG: hypothetical protein J6Q65_04025, partial [Lentisphaeria bacterium]|nr:hypothetical protein [Lentisphaeria bacterium]
MKLRSFLFLAVAGFFCTAPLASADLQCVVIPALSPYRHLPGEQDPDAEIRNDLTILMAQNETGHAAFLLKPSADENDVMIIPSDLRSEKGGVIPASAMDLRIVKYWYQDGTAWSSYFADPTQQELVPELLLHDENLVKVDLKNRRNYLRVGDDYRWMNYPETIKPGTFNYLTEPVADAPTLRPFTLSPAEKHKRFFLTLRADVPADIYKGTLTVKTPQKTLTTLSLTVRVLPFRLPRPKTWYNRNKTFLSAMRIEGIRNDYERLGRDLKKLEAWRLKMYRSMREHNIDYPLVSDPENYGRLTLEESLKLFRSDLTWMKQSGFPSDMMIGGVKGFSWNLLYQAPEKWPAGYEEKFYAAMDRDLKIIREIFGEQIIVYPEGWNEPGMKTLQKQRPTFRKIHEKGMRVQQTGN